MKDKLYKCPNTGQTSLGASLSSGYQAISHKIQIHTLPHSVCGSKVLKFNSNTHYWLKEPAFIRFVVFSSCETASYLDFISLLQRC